MALKLLQVLVLGVIATAADDVPVTWSASGRTALPCAVVGADRLRPRRPPPPLEADERPRAKPYLWRHDNVDINPKWVSPNGTLEVTKKREKEGVYQCAMRHHGGLILGYPINLKFASIEKEADKVSWPASVSATVGQPAVLNCLVRSAPPANITWMKGEQIISADDRHHLLPRQLLISDVQSEDAGSYRCVATNDLIGKSRFAVANLTVEDELVDREPAFLPVEFETNIVAARGSRVVLPCPVVGWPRPRLTWKLTPPDGRTSELESMDQVLVLPALEYDQEGVYTCEVDGHSDMVKTFKVTIPEIPVIKIPPASTEAPRASTVRFNCTASGKPAPNITWYKDAQRLVLIGRINLRLSADRKRTELVISGVTSDDAGVYQCFAHNGVAVASAWATLNVTGDDVDAPSRVQCWPEGARAVRVVWHPPAAEHVVAYTVHHMLQEDKPGTSLPNLPHNNTQELVVVEPLTPYRFQVRAYMQPTANNKNVASDLSDTVVCEGQGVPIKMVRSGEDSMLVSWKQFTDEVQGVEQWMLQYRSENSSDETNVILDGSVYNYTLKVPSNTPLQVRVLGSKTLNWLQQNLTLVPWSSTTAVHEDEDAGEVPPVPYEVEISQVGAREVMVTWRCERAIAERLLYTVCIRKLGADDECKDVKSNWVRLEGLQPDTQYEVRVQARSAAGRAGAFSEPATLNTLRAGTQRFMNITSHFVNSTTLRVSWNGEPARYTVRYSAQLKLPVEQWDSIETRGNTVLITGIDPADKTYVMVTGYDPDENSMIETIPPQREADLETKDVRYEYTRSGVRVSWTGVGPRLVCYAQNITRPVEQWASIDATEPNVELTDLDPSLPTYVIVTASGKMSPSQVLTIEPRPRKQSSLLYTGVGIGVGALILCALAIAAVCFWRKRKRSRSPVRSRRRNVSATEGNEEEGSEMKNIGGRLANGGGSKDAGEPLLNGHVHITENPTSKTPNGKMKKRRHYEPAFDVSRYEDPDVTLESVLEADSSAATPYNLLDTSRRPDRDTSRSSRDVSANNSFNKLPDDNMNLEINRSTFELDNSKIQPMLQPNG